MVIIYIFGLLGVDMSERASPASSTNLSLTATSPIDTIPTNVPPSTNLMAEHQIRRLPVVEGGTLVGIVSIGDAAVRDRLVEEAGDALSDISTTSRIW